MSTTSTVKLRSFSCGISPRNVTRRPGLPLCAPVLLIFLGFIGALTGTSVAQPIRLHPSNPRWFEWRGKGLALITSAEHYGAVLNLDFDYRRYLETLERDGLNYTRLFAGSYVEPQGAFGIGRNTLAPGPGKFLAPWARSDQPGYAGGGNKFDLERFSPEYLARLKSFIAEAGKRGVVVELTLFCSTYGEKQWAVHRLNPTNNIQGLVIPGWQKLHVLLPGAEGSESQAANPAMEVQSRLVRWLVRELNGFDNLFFEIQNEPWADHHAMGDFINPYMVEKHSFPNAVEVTSPESVAWQRAIARIIRNEESRLPQRHLIAQNAANFRLSLNDGDLVSEAEIIHFHYAYPEAVDWNRGFGRVIGYDETGFAGNRDETYRRQAWNFVLSGGALFNNLDYSFTVGHEKGTDTGNPAPGGGSPTLRRQLRVLSEFLLSFDIARLHPDREFVQRAPGVVVRALSDPGKAYALYVQGRSPTTLSVKLPAGTWTVEWRSVDDGRIVKREKAAGNKGGPTALASPEFNDAVAVRVIVE
jgi:hypothetical protein